MSHEAFELTLNVGLRRVHIPEVRFLKLVQVVLIEDGAGHGRYEVLGRPVDLLHERPVVLHFLSENIGLQVKG